MTNGATDITAIKSKFAKAGLPAQQKVQQYPPAQIRQLLSPLPKRRPAGIVQFILNVNIRPMDAVTIKRIYEDASEKDGYRILVDRIWPRGISKQRAGLDEWNKTIAPSTELRKWFEHKAERFEAFTKLYQQELQLQQEELERVRKIAKNRRLTLLYAAKDARINHAIVLRNVLMEQP